MNLEELAAKVEAATGPNWSLDIEIARATGFPVPQVPTGGSIQSWGSLPRYTASLDAAMTLAPEGIGDGTTEEIKVERWGGNGVYAPHVRASAWVAGARRTFAATMPLALTAAALRARSAMQKGR